MLTSTGIAPFGPLIKGHPAAPSGFDWNRPGTDSSSNMYTGGGYGLHVESGEDLFIVGAVNVHATRDGAETAPPAVTATPAEGQEVDGSTGLSVEYSCTDASEIVRCAGTLTYPGGQTEAMPANRDHGGHFVAAGPAQPGAYRLTVTAEDVFGNRTILKRDFSVVETAVAGDTVAPTVVTTSPADGATITYGASATAGWGCQDDVELASCDGTLTGPGGSVPITHGAALPTTAPGAYNLSVTALDAAGNPRVQVVTFDVLESGSWSPPCRAGRPCPRRTTPLPTLRCRPRWRCPQG